MNNTATTPQYAATLSPVAPPSPVAGLVHQLSEAQSQTHILLADLESRLQSVLESRPEKTGEACDTPKPGYASALCNDLSQRVEIELNAQSRLRSILNALVV